MMLWWAALPKWVRDMLVGAGALLLVLFTLVLTGRAYVEGEKKKVRTQERANAKRERDEQIASQQQETSERVQSFNDASRAVERMPEPELRASTETDPNNRGRVRRD